MLSNYHMQWLHSNSLHRGRVLAILLVLVMCLANIIVTYLLVTSHTCLIVNTITTSFTYQGLSHIVIYV